MTRNGNETPSPKTPKRPPRNFNVRPPSKSRNKTSRPGTTRRGFENGYRVVESQKNYVPNKYFLPRPPNKPRAQTAAPKRSVHVRRTNRRPNQENINRQIMRLLGMKFIN